MNNTDHSLLQRFKQNNGSASKIETKVSFPLKLDMSLYTNRARGQDLKQNMELARSCTYELQSVVVHVGNLETGESEERVFSLPHTNSVGHYISYSRVGNQVMQIFSHRSHQLNSFQWFKFNDHNVTLATKSDVLGAEAFLLFYVIQSLA